MTGTGRHVYLAAAIRGELVRAAMGLLLLAILIALAPPGGWLFWLLAGLALLAVAYSAIILRRAMVEVALDTGGIALVPRGPAGRALGAFIAQRLDWQDLTGVRLRGYGAPRGRPTALLTLDARGRRRIAIDETLDGFVDVAARVLAEAESRGVAIGPYSHENLDALRARGGA